MRARWRERWRCVRGQRPRASARLFPGASNAIATLRTSAEAQRLIVLDDDGERTLLETRRALVCAGSVQSLVCQARTRVDSLYWRIGIDGRLEPLLRLADWTIVLTVTAGGQHAIVGQGDIVLLEDAAPQRVLVAGEPASWWRRYCGSGRSPTDRGGYRRSIAAATWWRWSAPVKRPGCGCCESSLPERARSHERRVSRRAGVCRLRPRSLSGSNGNTQPTDLSPPLWIHRSVELLRWSFLPPRC